METDSGGLLDSEVYLIWETYILNVRKDTKIYFHLWGSFVL